MKLLLESVYCIFFFLIDFFFKNQQKITIRICVESYKKFPITSNICNIKHTLSALKIPRVLLENPPREMKIPSWNLFSFDNTDSRVLPVFNVPEVEECIRISKQKLCTVAYDFKNSANQCKLNGNRCYMYFSFQNKHEKRKNNFQKRQRVFSLQLFKNYIFSSHCIPGCDAFQLVQWWW